MLNGNIRGAAVLDVGVPMQRELTEYLRHSGETPERPCLKSNDLVLRKDYTLGSSSKPKQTYPNIVMISEEMMRP